MRQIPRLTSQLQKHTLYQKILLLVFSAEVSNNMMLVLIMYIFVGNKRSLGLNLNHAQQLMMYGIAIFISRIGGIFANTGLGSLSDIIGREQLMRLACIALLVLAWLGSISIAFNLIYLFFLSLLIYSTCFCLRPLALAEAGQINDEQKKLLNIGYLQGSIALGATLGPLISTHLNHLSHAFIFMLAGCFSLVALFLCPKKTPKKQERKQWQYALKSMLASWRLILSKPIVRIGLLLLTLDQLAWSSYYDFIPVTLKLTFNWPINQVGDFIAAIALCLIICCWLILPLLKRKLSTKQIMFYSAIMLLTGLLITVHSTQLTTHALMSLLIGMLLTACGDVLFYSTLISRLSDLTAKDNQGSLMGMNYLIIGLTWSTTGLWGGWLSQFSSHLVLMTAAIFAFILCLILAYNRKQLNSVSGS